MSGLVINGRFLANTQTGLHRVARSLIDAAGSVDPAAFHPEILAPPGVTDPRVTRTVWGPTGRGGRQFWEQTSLPLAARNRWVLSLANTAPLGSPHTITMIHDLSTIVGPQWFADSMRWYARLVRLAARRATLVLTVSEQVRRELVEVGVPWSKSRVIRNAVDPSFTPASAAAVAAARSAYGLNRDFLLMVGWSDPRKDLATVTAAHLAALKTHPHDLVLVGQTHPAFAPVAAPDLPSVRALGYVDDATLRALLTGSSALVYPSLYEGFGLPVQEAWACGTPALATDIPAIRESSEGKALLLPPGAVEQWSHGMLAALDGQVPVPAPLAWTWADAAQQLLAVLAEVGAG